MIFKERQTYWDGGSTILNANTGRNISKTKNELSVQDKINLTLNAKVMNVLYNALDAVRIQVRNTQLLRYQVHNNLMINKSQA